MIDVIKMISMMGCTPEEIIDAGLLRPNQKPKPRYSGDDELVLDMLREGVFLAFDRKTKTLQRMALTISNELKPNYVFPNILPQPLKVKMTKEFVSENLGKPYESKPPVKILNTMTGGVDHYLLKKASQNGLSQLIYYTKDQKHVKNITYMHTKDVSWGRHG